MDLNAFLTFLTNAQQHKQTCIATLQPLGLLFQHVSTQFEWTFNWFVRQTTAQFLSCLESTHNYGNTPPELRPQILLYLLNELAQNRLVLEEFNNQIDLLKNHEGPQIVEMIDQAAETNSDGRAALIAFPVEEQEKEQTFSQSEEEEEPEHLRKLFIKRLNDKTTDAAVKVHFAQFGTVLKFSRFRDFGFITYSRASMVEGALQAGAHLINGLVVVAKRDDPMCRDASKKRIHLAGLGQDIGQSDLREYFAKYGNVVQVKSFMSKETRCALVQFDVCGPVERVVLESHHLIKGQVIEVTRYLLKQQVDSINRDARAGGRDVIGSGGYNRGNERYGNDGRYGRYGLQSQSWNQQSHGQQQHEQVGQSWDYGNSRGGRGTGGGPIRRQHNRLHSWVGPYRNKK